MFNQLLVKNTYKIACSVRIKKKKIFCQNSDKFGNSFIKNDVMFMYLLCIYIKPVILGLFKIDTLNFTMYILTILTCPLKPDALDYVTLMNIFFTIIIYHSFFI